MSRAVAVLVIAESGSADDWAGSGSYEDPDQVPSVPRQDAGDRHTPGARRRQDTGRLPRTPGSYAGPRDEVSSISVLPRTIDVKKVFLSFLFLPRFYVF